MKRHAPAMFVSALLLLPLFYIGSYFALADHAQVSPWLKQPRFRVGGKPAVYFYKPMLFADLLIRPDYWFDRAVHDAAMQRQNADAAANNAARQQKLKTQ